MTIKTAFSRFIDVVENASRYVLEHPFAEREGDVDHCVHAILRMMHQEKLELLDGVYVPDHYTIYLPRPLYQHYQGYLGERLCLEIAEEVHRQIERWDYEVQHPVEVRLADGGHGDSHRIEVECQYQDEAAARAAAYRVIPSSDPMAHFQQGRRLQAEQRFEEAKKEFHAALRLNRRLAPAYFNLGAIAFQQCRYQEAVRYYEQGLEITPNQVAAHADVAKAYEMLGAWSRAIAHLTRAAAIQPEHPVIQRRLARVREEAQLYATLRSRLETEWLRPQTRARTDRFRLQHFTLCCAETFPAHKRASLESMLESIYQQLGAVFGVHPEERLEVIILPGDVRGHAPFPSWAGAYYDGRIHLVWNPRRPIELAVAYLLLRHEFTHVLVESLADKACPAWLDEGLAEWCTRKLMQAESQILRRAVHQGRVIPLEALERGFQKVPQDQIRLAYIQAHAMVGYLIDRFEMRRVVHLLRQLGRYKHWREAIQQEWGISPFQLEKGWLDSVRRERP